MIAGLMLGAMCLVMAIVPMRSAPIEEVLEREARKKEQIRIQNLLVLDDPESHRYKIGEIDWRQIERNKK